MVEQFLETIKTLNQMQADGVIGKYAIGGAIGAEFYLEPTTSLDMDIFISFDDLTTHPMDPLRPIFDYLIPRGGKVEREHVMIHGSLIQFLPVVSDLQKEALAGAIQADVRGTKPWVMTAEHLIAIALAVGRRKDEVRVERFIELGRYDFRKLDPILKRYGLVDKWKAISDQYTDSQE